MNLLDLAKKKYWVDNDNDGKNDKYDYGLGGTGETDFEKESPEGTSGKGKLDIDCSHLVNNVLNEAGYNIPYETTSSMKNSKYYDPVSPNDVQPGDIVLFEGHVGFVASYDVNTKTGKFFGSQTSTGPAETEFSTDSTITNSRSGSPYYWGGRKKFLKFLRPKSFFNYPEKVRNNLKEGTRRVDPLVIDLDGDGIELRDIKESNAMFDLTGSGFANRVGWVSPDDGFLVWDRNGNGRVDDISEMFGNANQSGFQALSLYDTNRDGKIDAFDDVFKNLKIWQDRDGDGRTDERELKNLAELGIKAINLNTTHTNINQGGNQITEIGSVEKEDGTETQAGNVNFELDRLYSYYNREVKLNPEIVGLPWVRGYGFMPDLPIAMSLDETLLNMVKDAIAEPDLTKLKEKFEKIIFRWAGVERIKEEELGISWAILNGNDREHRLLHFDGGITLSYEQVGAIEKFVGATPEEVIDGIRHRSGQFLLEAWNTMFQGLFTRFVVDAGLLEGVLPVYYDFFTDRIVLDESFDAQSFNAQIKQMLSSDDNNQSAIAIISLIVLKEVNALDENLIKELYTDTSTLSKFINNPYRDFLVKAIIGTESNEYLYGSQNDDIILGRGGDDYTYGFGGNDILIGGEGNDTLYGGDGDDILVGGSGDDYLSGDSGKDTYIFNKGDGKDTIYDYSYSDEEVNTIVFGEGINKDNVEFLVDGSDLVIKLKDTGDSLRINYWFWSDNYSRFQFKFADGTTLSKADIDSAGYTVEGTNGNDWLYGSYSKDIVLGKEGDDRLYGYAGDDILFGGEGDDTLYGGDDNDTLIGGPGNDVMYGGAGSDTYVFNRGDGEDIILDEKYNKEEVNTLVFGERITKDELDFVKDGNDLVVKIKSGSDSIRIKKWFVEYEYFPLPVDYKIDIFKFADGTVLTKDEVENSGYKVYGDEKDNYLNGSDKNDTIYGYGGNDSLYGNKGDDIIYGGDGNDSLQGGDGNDVLVGGKGDDYMEGGSGSDTYVFNKGDGQDTIYADNEDTLKFGEGITKEDLEFTRNGYNLVIHIKGTEDRITIEDWFNSESSKIGKIEFYDGTTLTKEEIDRISDYNTIKGTKESDILYGTRDNDIILGLDGDDYIYGWDGDDTLVGGPGNDYIEGGLGNDTYIFNKGDGQDTIYINEIIGNLYAYPTGYLYVKVPKSGAKRVILGEGINKEDLDFIKEDKDLVVKIKNTQDSIRVKDYFVSENGSICLGGITYVDHKIDEIILSDGTILKKDEIELKGFKVIGTDGDDNLSGYYGNDVIYGRAGDDILYGDNGNDTLIGGAGNDFLEGGDGEDIYIFNRGDGQDTIYEYGNEINTVKFGDGITKEDVEFKRDGYDLVILVKNSSDSIRILYWFDYYWVINLEFSDGTIFTKEQINSIPELFTLIGTDKDDYIRGGEFNETIYGLDENDTIYGDLGDDTLIGGKGNDYIEDHYGNNTFVFNRIDGKDTWDLIPFDGSSVIIKFGDGITKQDLIFERRGSGLLIKIADTEDSIFIPGLLGTGSYEDGEYYVVDRTFYQPTIYPNLTIELSDGSKLPFSEIINQVAIKGTDSNDNLYGTEYVDIIIGGKGDDTIYGKDGYDFYIFNPGDGKDTLLDENGYGIVLLNTDKDKVVFFKDGDNLVIGYSENDFVKVVNQFKEGEGIERVIVKDGQYITRWDIENIVSAIIDFKSEQNTGYTQKYNELINSQQYVALISESWQNNSRLVMLA